MLLIPQDRSMSRQVSDGMQFDTNSAQEDSSSEGYTLLDDNEINDSGEWMIGKLEDET
jgi:hypothetical protein